MARGDQYDENGNPIDPTADPTDPTPGGELNNGITRQQVIDWYQKYNGRAPESEAIIQGWMHNPQGAAAVEAAISGSPEAKAFAAKGATPPPAAPPPGPATGGAPPSTQFPPWDKPWTPPAWTPTPDAPTFKGPDYKPPPAYVAPTAAEALNDPGYQFRLDQGRSALERSAAMRGVSNTGMNLRDILDYGQNAASQEYQNVDARSRNTYATNYESQYLQPYKFSYQSALDTFNPSFDAWKTNAGNTQRTNEFNTSNSLRNWEDQYNQFLNEQRDRWGRAKDVLAN